MGDTDFYRQSQPTGGSIDQAKLVRQHGPDKALQGGPQELKVRKALGVGGLLPGLVE